MEKILISGGILAVGLGGLAYALSGLGVLPADIGRTTTLQNGSQWTVEKFTSGNYPVKLSDGIWRKSDGSYPADRTLDMVDMQ